jgi:hypothetical protein
MDPPSGVALHPAGSASTVGLRADRTKADVLEWPPRPATPAGSAPSHREAVHPIGGNGVSKAGAAFASTDDVLTDAFFDQTARDDDSRGSVTALDDSSDDFGRSSD